MSNQYRKFTSMFILSITLFTLLIWQQRVDASDNPYAPENSEVIAAIEAAYAVIDTPFDTLDLNRLDDVLIDHPDYANALDSKSRTTLQKQIHEMLGSTADNQFGYLTAMKSKRTYLKRGVDLLKPAMQKAKSENRKLTAEEWKELAKQNGGLEPSLPNYELANHKRSIKYLSIQINGDKARVVYDEGVVTSTAILVKVNGKWFVAGIF